MPNFTARVTAGATVVDWDDPETPTAPSRINPPPTHPLRYLQVTPPDTLVVQATVDGVEGEVDANLGGELFQAHLAEWSGDYPPAFAPIPGQSSVVRVQLTAQHLGHHLLVLRRENGGAVVVPFDVEV